MLRMPRMFIAVLRSAVDQLVVCSLEGEIAEEDCRCD